MLPKFIAIGRCSNFLFGLISNLIGLITFSRKKFSKFSNRYIYITILLVDTTFLFYRAFDKLLSWVLNFFLSSISQFSCKITKFITYSYFPISVYLLIWISIERFISIKYPNMKLIKNKFAQFWIILIVVIYNCIIYIPVPLFFSLTNNTNNTICYLSDDYSNLIKIIDLLQSTVLPFILMVVFSLLLMHTIFQSRLRILRMTRQLDRSRLKKDIKFAITSITLNALFIVLNLPLNVFELMKINSDLREYFYFVFFFGSCVNFHVLFFSNPIFRKEVVCLFRIKNK